MAGRSLYSVHVDEKLLMMNPMSLEETTTVGNTHIFREERSVVDLFAARFLCLFLLHFLNVHLCFGSGSDNRLRCRNRKPSIHPSVRPPVRPPARPPARPSVRPPIHPSIHTRLVKRCRRYLTDATLYKQLNIILIIITVRHRDHLPTHQPAHPPTRPPAHPPLPSPSPHRLYHSRWPADGLEDVHGAVERSQVAADADAVAVTDRRERRYGDAEQAARLVEMQRQPVGQPRLVERTLAREGHSEVTRRSLGHYDHSHTTARASADLARKVNVSVFLLAQSGR